MRPLGLLLSCAWLLASPLFAADGDADPAFSLDGKVTVLWDEDGETQVAANGVAALADGSLVVGGTLGWLPTGGGLGADSVLAKLTQSGILDTSWGEGGRKRVAFDLVEWGADTFHGVFADPDGSVYAVGTTYDGATQVPTVVRLLANGDGDPAFGDAGYLYVAPPWSDPDLRFLGAARQLDGKLLLAGHCLRCSSNTTHFNPFVLRLLEDGTPDPTWSFDGWAIASDGGTSEDFLTAFAPDSQGRVVIAFKADGDVRVARLNTIGGLDSAFGSDGFIDLSTEFGIYSVVAIAIDPRTRKIYLVFSGNIAGAPAAYVIRRWTSGAEDASYAGDGVASFVLEEGTDLEDAVLQGDGKLLLAGRIDANGAQTGGFFLARLDGAGALDDTFDGNGVARYEFDRTLNGEDHALALTLAGGKPLAVGHALDANGERDMAILRVENSYLFADGFEAGHTLLWSPSAP